MARRTDVEIRAILAEQELPEDHAEQVEKEAERLRVRRAAAQLVAQEESARDFILAPSSLTLADELAVQDPPLEYSVDGLHPRGANTLLGAAFKAGKTTLLANLLRALLDDEIFLGEYKVDPAPGRVAYWNYEVTDRQFRSWLRTVGVKNQEAGAVWNLRGHRMDLSVPFIEDQAVGWLKERRVGTLIIDPYSRAFRGEENNNTDVGRFLESLDVIKHRAGVVDLFMAAHFGRGEQEEGAERVRGATRLDDWADVRWLLTKGKDEDKQRRYFKAEGRDVLVAQRGLKFDPANLSLSLAGGSRSQDRRQKQQNELMKAVVEAVAAQPGINSEDLRKKVTGGRTELKDAAVKGALNGRLIRTERDGAAVRHYLDRGQPESPGEDR